MWVNSKLSEVDPSVILKRSAGKMCLIILTKFWSHFVSSIPKNFREILSHQLFHF